MSFLYILIRKTAKKKINISFKVYINRLERAPPSATHFIPSRTRLMARWRSATPLTIKKKRLLPLGLPLFFKRKPFSYIYIYQYSLSRPSTIQSLRRVTLLEGFPLLQDPVPLSVQSIRTAIVRRNIFFKAVFTGSSNYPKVSSSVGGYIEWGDVGLDLIRAAGIEGSDPLRTGKGNDTYIEVEEAVRQGLVERCDTF